MYKRIDDVQDEEISGYSFVDDDGEEIYVGLQYDSDYVEVGNSDSFEFAMYKKDIPKLIKALEAAYKHEVIHNHKEV